VREGQGAAHVGQVRQERVELRAAHLAWLTQPVVADHRGNRETLGYALHLNLENIEHTRTKAKSAQTNGVCERFHLAIQNGYHAIAFRRRL
jgi:hypothetical protein